MSREWRRREAEVPARVITESFQAFTCDSCGRQLTHEWPEGEEQQNTAHELVIMLDQDECVNFFRRRDFCPQCLNPVWDAINTLLGADPDAERDRDYDDM